MTKEWQEYRDTQNKKHADERAQYNATVREDPSKYVGDNVTKEWQEYRDEQNRKHAEKRRQRELAAQQQMMNSPFLDPKGTAERLAREKQMMNSPMLDPGGKGYTNGFSADPGQYTDRNNPNRYYADTIRDDAGRYTDPNNKNGWYSDVGPASYDREYVKKLQKELGLPQTGVWDKKTNNAYERWKTNPNREKKYFEGFTPDAGKYTDESNINGWYAGVIPTNIGSVEALKELQKGLGVRETGKWDRATHNAYQIWRKKQDSANGTGTGYTGNRDWNNNFVVGNKENGLGRLFGMKYDTKDKMFYHSKKRGFQEWLGFHEIFDTLGNAAFNLDTAKTDFVYNGKNLSHRIWLGDYYAPGFFGEEVFEWMKPVTGVSKPGVYGGESSLFVSEKNGFDQYADEDQFIQQVTVKDGNGKTIVHFDSTEMYADNTSDWVFAAKGGTNKPATIEGTITYSDKGLLEALMASSKNSEISYKYLRRNSDGTWSVNWSAKAA